MTIQTSRAHVLTAAKDTDTGGRRRARPAATAADGAPADLPAKAVKLAEIVAGRIAQDLVSNRCAPGTVLGNEAELMQRYAVSRATLREAVRQVERHGLAAMRRGIGGGLVALEPARQPVVFALASYLQLADVGIAELYEAREILESHLVKTAALRSDAESRERLHGAAAALLEAPIDTYDNEVERYLQLRVLIGVAAGNPAIDLLTEALTHLTMHLLRGIPKAAASAQIRRTRRAAAELAVAIASGNRLHAQAALRAELQEERQLIDAQLRRHEQRAARQGDAAWRGAATGRRAVDQKLGHRISVAISRDIAALGWPRGQYLGSESQLQQRYGVSRAVLREAIRTLELHAIVRVKRGQSGGLLIGTPDPAYTVATATRYLRRIHLQAEHFYEIWKTLQFAAAKLAAGRLDPSGLRALASAAADVETAPAAALYGASSALHVQLSVLSGNRALALFATALGELAPAYPGAPPPAELSRLLKRSHVGLVHAIASGKPTQAQRGMLRHLRVFDAWFGRNAELRAWLAQLSRPEPFAAIAECDEIRDALPH